MWAALVAPSDAEDTRRSLDRQGFLRTDVCAFRAPCGAIALPLKPGSEEAIKDMRIEQLERPPRAARSQRRGLHQRCLRALKAAGCADAEALLPEAALPRHWEKLGDIVLFAQCALFSESSQEAAARLSPEERRALWQELASALGASRVGVQGRIDQTLQRKSGARLCWPQDGGPGWTLHKAPARPHRATSRLAAPVPRTRRATANHFPLHTPTHTLTTNDHGYQ